MGFVCKMEAFKKRTGSFDFSYIVRFFRSEWWPKHFDVQKTLGVFLWSSNSEYRMSRNVKAAFAIYSEFVGAAHRVYIHPRARRAVNRLGMMYHRGIDGISADISIARSLYMRATGDANSLTKDKINAMCNLAVLYGNGLMMRKVLGNRCSSSRM